MECADIIKLRGDWERQSSTARCGIVTLLNSYGENRHSVHRTNFGPATFRSPQVYQQSEGSKLTIPENWQSGQNAASPPSGARLLPMMCNVGTAAANAAVTATQVPPPVPDKQ